MNFVRLGLVDLFGIFAPGVLLLLTILAGFAPRLKVSDQDAYSTLAAFAADNDAISLIIFFFVSYLLGSLLRLGGVEATNTAAYKWRRFLRRSAVYLRRKRVLRASNRLKKFARKNWSSLKSFPYPAVFEALRTRGDKRLLARLKTRYPDFETPRGTTLFNACKLIICAQSQELFLECKRAESAVRFYAGTFWAMVIASAVFFYQSLATLCKFLTAGSEWEAWCAGFVTAFGITMAAVFVIVHRFPEQRAREATLVWNCTALVLDDEGRLPSECRSQTAARDQDDSDSVGEQLDGRRTTGPQEAPRSIKRG